ncbi:MAG: hypothetical protein K8S54_15500 [Spirochaetia bacterium]|nr:hypothetical protein [Spirochaetia bacterium]
MRLTSFLLFLCCCSALSAEIIYLRDGTQVEGTIYAQNGQFIDLKTPSGNRRIQKTLVRRIAYDTAQVKREEEARAKARREATIKEMQRLQALRMQEEEAKRMQDVARQNRLANERAEAARQIREKVESKELDKPDEPIGFLDFAWRSALVPGWGHFAIDRPIVGGIYMGAMAGALYNVYDKRKSALAAKKANANEVLLNTLYSVQPGDVPLAGRIAFGTETNRRALITYQSKINRYNYSLGLVAGIYAVQMVHIIFNGLAWEKGSVVQGPAVLEVSIRPQVQPASISRKESPGDIHLKAGLTFLF